MLLDEPGQNGCCGQSEVETWGNSSGSSGLTEDELMKYDFNDWAGKSLTRTMQT